MKKKQVVELVKEEEIRGGLAKDVILNLRMGMNGNLLRRKEIKGISPGGGSSMCKFWVTQWKGLR